MILNRQRRVAVSLAALERFWQRVRRVIGLAAGSVTICLVSDAQIARWNRAYRRKRGPTDVLSFPAAGPGLDGRGRKQRPRAVQKFREALTVATTASSGRSKPPNEAGYLGDIAIAPAVARRNARRLGRSLDRELRILVLHGTLHLAGYDHETDSGEMHRLERRLRRRLGLE